MTIPAPSPQTIDHAWRAWIAENLALGSAAEPLVGVLVDNGFDPEEARHEVATAGAAPISTPPGT